MTPEKIYQRNKESIMMIKGNLKLDRILITFNDESNGLEGTYKCNDIIGTHFSIDASDMRDYMYDIIHSNQVQSILNMIENKDYTRTIASYSNKIQDNVIPIKISYHRDNILSDKWNGYFINLDNGSIYHIEAGRLRNSKYKYEFHTIYLDGLISKHINNLNSPI